MKLFLLPCFFIVLLTSAKEMYSYCPNGQSPKTNRAGEFIQCLPGYEGLCGDDHTCFYSGINYQCCPRLNDQTKVDFSRSKLRCATPMKTIVRNDGSPLKCNPIASNCPKKSMVCSKVEKEFICCEENFGVSQYEGTAKINKERRVPFPKCPKKSYVVRSHPGHQISCRDKLCHQRNRFCHEGFCCEKQLFVKKSRPILYASKTERKRKIHSSRFILDSTADRKANENLKGSQGYIDGSILSKELKKDADGKLKKLSIKIVESPESSTSIPELVVAETSKPKSDTFVSVNQEIASTSLTSPTRIPATTVPETKVNNTNEVEKKLPVRKTNLLQETKIFGLTGTGERDAIKFVQNDSSGYSISQNAQKIKEATEDDREFVRQFLNEQIRNGWPYNEKFYRAYAEDGRKFRRISAFKIH